MTGILTDTNAVTACLHRNGALAFWDYATAGTCIEITKQGSLNIKIGNNENSLLLSESCRSWKICPDQFLSGFLIMVFDLSIVKSNLSIFKPAI